MQTEEIGVSYFQEQYSNASKIITREEDFPPNEKR